MSVKPNKPGTPGLVFTRKILPEQFKMVENYGELKRRYAALAKKVGYGARWKYPRHPLLFDKLYRDFPHEDVRSAIDFETILDGSMIFNLFAGSRGIDRQSKSPKPIETVHGTTWLLDLFRDNFNPLLMKEELKGHVEIYPHGYQDLCGFENQAYDLCLSLNVLDHLLDWDDARAARDDIVRIAKIGAIFSTETNPKSKVAMIARMPALQIIGLKREEWDTFFAEINAKYVGDGYYVWLRSENVSGPRESGGSDAERAGVVPKPSRKRRGRPPKRVQDAASAVGTCDTGDGTWEYNLAPGGPAESQGSSSPEGDPKG